ADAPVDTIASQGLHHGLSYATLVKWYGADDHGQAIDAPMHTITAKHRFALLIGRGVAIDQADAATIARAMQVGELLATYHDPRRPEDLELLVPVLVEDEAGNLVGVGRVAMVEIRRRRR